MSADTNRAAVLAAVAGLVALQGWAFAVPAFACHQQAAGHDSVDGGEIRWEDHTKWDDARTWANVRWNELDQINIVADDAWHTNDLDWGDYSDRTDPRAGYWQYRDGIADDDYIRLNDFHFNGFATAKRRHVATHELGHALGLTEFRESAWSGQVMYVNVNSVYYLQTHDVADYHERWGY